MRLPFYIGTLGKINKKLNPPIIQFNDSGAFISLSYNVAVSAPTINFTTKIK